MNIAELYRALQCHDWFYARSDDPRVYHRGNENWDRLQREMMAVEGGPELVREYSKHVFSGPAFGTPKHPKPDMPKEAMK
jgi:hypothetical protein